MYTLRCPHCENEIELLGQKDLTREYRLTPNKVVRLLQLKEMPEPVLAFENRRMWTRQQLENWRTEQGAERVQVLLTETEDALAALPAEQREVFLQALLAQAQHPQDHAKK